MLEIRGVCGQQIYDVSFRTTGWTQVKRSSSSQLLSSVRQCRRKPSEPTFNLGLNVFFFSFFFLFQLIDWWFFLFVNVILMLIKSLNPHVLRKKNQTIVVRCPPVLWMIFHPSPLPAYVTFYHQQFHTFLVLFTYLVWSSSSNLYIFIPLVWA